MMAHTTSKILGDKIYYKILFYLLHATMLSKRRLDTDDIRDGNLSVSLVLRLLEPRSHFHLAATIVLIAFSEVHDEIAFFEDSVFGGRVCVLA
jgi:hypothetical protein